MIKGKILLVLMPFGLALHYATQNIAAFCQYDQLLGNPLFYYAGQPFYGFWDFFVWWYKFSHIIPKVFSAEYTILSIGLFISLLFLFLLNFPGHDDSFGSAHWGEYRDIKKMKLFSSSGVVLGLYDSFFWQLFYKLLKSLEPNLSTKLLYKFMQYIYSRAGHCFLKDCSDKHIAVVAPTRSGKGIGVILPTLLGGWRESVVVNDIKSENWGITAGYRKKMGQKVIKFEPTASDGSSARWNPLDEIKIGTAEEIATAQNVADVIANFDGLGQMDHWKANAANVIMAVILHLKYAHFADPQHYPEQPSLATVAGFLKTNFIDEEAVNEKGEPIGETVTTPKNFLDTLGSLMNFPHVPPEGIDIEEWDNKTLTYRKRHFSIADLRRLYPHEASMAINPCVHPIIYKAFVEIYSKPDLECGSIISTANTALKEYLDPVLRMNTEVSDFCLDDVMNYDKPVSLYLVTPPSDLYRLSPLFRLFFEMLIRHHTKYIGTYVHGRSKPVYKHKCLLLMDEFASLGNLKNLTASLAFIAGYGIKAFLVLQGLPQITSVYGADNQILMNCHFKIFFSPNDNETASYVEALLGKKTISEQHIGYDSFSCLFPKHYTHTHMGRSLFTAEEVKRLGDKEIIVATGFPPLLVDKIKYYEYELFQKKLLDAPRQSDLIRTHSF